MKERILLAPGINDAELLRSLARYGVNTIGLRVMGGAGLAEFALMKSGICSAGKHLSLKEQVYEMFRYMQSMENGYFTGSSYADAENLCRAVNNFRKYVPSDKVAETLKAGEFREKNDALLDAYLYWTEYLEKNSCSDSISIIKLALEKAGALDTEVTVLEECRLSLLENNLLKKIAPDSRTVTLPGLFGKEASSTDIFSFTQAYGASNEIEDIIAEICARDIPLDKCTIALADAGSYAQTVFDFCQIHDIPATFGCGVPITNSNPARLLKLLEYWDTGKGFHGVDALRQLVMSSAFDCSYLEKLTDGSENPYKAINGAIDVAGALHLGMDGRANAETIQNYRRTVDTSDRGEARHFEYIDLTEKIFALFETGYADFIEKFSKLRRNNMAPLDASARTAICSVLKPLDESGDITGRNDAVGRLLTKTVGSSNSAEGRLHVTTLEGALSSVREYLFVAGLSSDCFPGKPKEDYLLLDSDYGDYAEFAPTSGNIMRDKRKLLAWVLREASAVGSEIHLSWSGYSLSDLKDKNVSSEVLSLYRNQYGKELKTEDIRQAGYFKNMLTAESAVGKLYSEGKHSLPAEPVQLSDKVVFNTERCWSYSGFSSFFKCKRKFYLETALGLRQPDPTDPYEVADAREFGTLIHKTMQKLGETKPRPDREQFAAICEDVFDSFLNWHAGRTEAKIEISRSEFMDVAFRAYDQDPGNEVVLAEESQKLFHEESGLWIEGYPDRIERDSNGRYIVVDYKTGKNLEHVKDDPLSCLQALMYAYMLEKLQGIKIDHCEFRYPKIMKTVSCRYDDGIKESMNALLKQFADGMRNGECAPTNYDGVLMKDENCKDCWCKFGPLCTRVREETEADAEK